MNSTGLTVLAFSFFLASDAVFAQLNRQKPDALQEVGVEERLGGQIPLDLTFADAEGDSVSIRELMAGGKPVILNPVYYECPQLCSMVKEGIFKAIRDLQWSPGKDYTIITFSFDPAEQPALAAQNRNEYLGRLGRPGAENGWYFLTGSPRNIRALTDAIGFEYRRVKNGQFAHGAAITFVSPEGTISRYLYGIEFEEFNFRNALYEAAGGNIGTAAEQVLLYCYQYDADANSYTPVAWRIMQVGGLASAIILGIFLGFMWLRHRSSNHKKQLEKTNGLY